MRVLIRNPLHPLQIDAVFMHQDAAYPGHRGLRRSAHTDTFAMQFGRLEHATRRVVGDERLLIAANHGGRQHHQRHPFGARLQIGHDGQLAEIELQVAHHALERTVGGFFINKIKRNQGRADRARLECLGMRMIAHERMQFQRLGRCAHTKSPKKCSVLSRREHPRFSPRVPWCRNHYAIVCRRLQATAASAPHPAPVAAR